MDAIVENLPKLIDLAGASTLNVALKIGLLVLLGAFGIWWKLRKRKAAKKASQRASIEAKRGAAQQARDIAAETRTAENEIDDILGE